MYGSAADASVCMYVRMLVPLHRHGNHLDELKCNFELLDVTRKVRARLASNMDKRGLRARFMKPHDKISRAYDMCMYMHPAFADLYYVEQMVALYNGGQGMCRYV